MRVSLLLLIFCLCLLWWAIYNLKLLNKLENRAIFGKKLKKLLPASASSFHPHAFSLGIFKFYVDFCFSFSGRIKDVKIENGVITQLLLEREEVWVELTQPMIPDYINNPGMKCPYHYVVSILEPGDPYHSILEKVEIVLSAFSPVPIFCYSLNLSQSFLEAKGIVKMQYPEPQPCKKSLKVEYVV